MNLFIFVSIYFEDKKKRLLLFKLRSITRRTDRRGLAGSCRFSMLLFCKWPVLREGTARENGRQLADFARQRRQFGLACLVTSGDMKDSVDCLAFRDARDRFFAQ